MKTHRLIPCIMTAAMLAVAALIVVPVLRAADKPETGAERKARLAREQIEKYDQNKNGKMDPEELAAEKTDKNKAAAEKRKATIQKKKEAAAAQAVENK